MTAFPVSESDIAMLAERLREGTQGRYELAGRRVPGDGYVEFDALQVGLERRVTLRVMRTAGDGSVPSRERVRARVRLSHPSIVPVLEVMSLGDLLVEVTPLVDDGSSWWTSRSLNGVSAEDPEAWRRTVLNVVRQVASALAFANVRGLVHGAVRPECVRFTDDGSVCVAGFLTGQRSADWSPYVSPELAGVGEGTALGDQYALGVLAYLLLTGELPFADAEHQQQGVPSSRLAGLSNAVRELILRMLSSSPEERFVSMDDVVRAVDLAAAGASSKTPRVGALDENVQFTVYRPAVVKPSQWYPMLAFAHLSEAREGSDEPDPVAVVERQAKQILEDAVDTYKKVSEDSAQPIPREGTITFVPEMAGVEFNPPRQSFEWSESVHRQDFRLRADAALNGKTARGRLTVFHGVIMLAELTLSIKVDEAYQAPPNRKADAPVSARPYRKIFASYSHKDVGIVRQFEGFATTLGDRYLIDSRDIRSGEVWSERLKELMREADIVQLFWSWNSMASPFVRQEWEYALSLGRPNFVRPTYWEHPMPTSPDGKLPTPELLQLQFQRIAASGAEFTQPVGPSDFTRVFSPASPAAMAPSSPVLMSSSPLERPSPMAPPPATMTPPLPPFAKMAPPPASMAPPPATMTPPSASMPPRAGAKWRTMSRVTAVAAVALIAVSVTTVFNQRSSAVPDVRPGAAPPTVDPGGGSGFPDPASPPKGGNPSTTAPPTDLPPPVTMGRRPPATLREVVSAYQRDSAIAESMFAGSQVEVDSADAAKVTFARPLDRRLVQTLKGSRKIYCQLQGPRSGRLVVSDCVAEQNR